MKRVIVVCMALLLALTPAATAEAAKGGKSKRAAKTCVAKKTAKGKSKKAKKAKKACSKAKKAKKTKKAPTATSEAALAQRDCREDQRLDPEAFAADFGAGADALARCAAELLAEGADDDVLEDEPLADELPEYEEPLEDFDAPDADDDELV